MKTVVVYGRLVDSETKEPVMGHVHFVPERMMHTEGGAHYATLAPTVVSDGEGKFWAQLTQTKGWKYQVHSPAGSWKIEVTGDGPYALRDLIKKARA